MSIIDVNSLTKYYGSQTVFEDVSLKIEQSDRIGLLGVNGAGKTTLFRLITGEEQADEGEVIRQNGLTISYMQQHSDFTSSFTAIDEVLLVYSELVSLEKELENVNKQLESNQTEELIKRQHSLSERFETNGGYIFRAMINSTLIGLGLKQDELFLPMSALSGGQRTRVLLAKILLSGSELLLLDEPTNHLDIQATRWLEDFLIGYKGTLFIISHDRFFLDKVTNKTFELENQALTVYEGNYTKYKQLKQEYIDFITKDYTFKQKEIERIEGIIEQQKRFNQKRNYITIKSKEKQIERIRKTVVKPPDELDEIGFSFKAHSGMGNDALFVRNLTKKFDDKTLFSDVNMFIKKSERVFLVGPNGCGKSTLFKIILNKIKTYSGEVLPGARVVFGYYDQNQQDISDEKTIYDEVFDAFPKMEPLAVRKALALFLFKGDEIYKRIKTLSGGEKARVLLVKLMLNNTNFLMLDEPTNHLDIQSKEALEDTLLQYDGTMLVISHDRYFINKLAQKIYELTPIGAVLYEGNYDFYIENVKNIITETEEKEEKPNAYRQKKEEESEKRKIKTRISRIEERIEQLEKEQQYLQNQLSDPQIAADYQKITEITDQIHVFETESRELFDEWEKLNG